MSHQPTRDELTFWGAVAAGTLTLVGVVVTAVMGWKGKQRETQVDEEALLVQQRTAFDARIDNRLRWLEEQVGQQDQRIRAQGERILALEEQLRTAQSQLAQTERALETTRLERDTALETNTLRAGRILELETERALLKAEVERLGGLLATGDGANEP